MGKFGKRIVKFVNHHWLFFGVSSNPNWGFLIGFALSYNARNQSWGWFTLYLLCCVAWMATVFMKSYTDRKNRK